MNNHASSPALPDFELNLKGRYCLHPFRSMELHLDGGAYVCCPSWLKTNIGEFKKEDIREIWNSPIAQDIRASIIDGSYKYCDKIACPFIQGEALPFYGDLEPKMKKYIDNKQVVLDTSPENVMFTFDASCNLSCPTCRSEKLSYTIDSNEYKDLNKLCHEITASLLKDPNTDLTLNITGSGDPFSSLAFRHFLESIDGTKYPNLKFRFQTNGLLLTPIMWERLSKIHNNIEHIYVSIDASTSETYAIVRRGGHFSVIMENMRFICKLRADKKFKHLKVNFVVQQKNYKEIPQFAKIFLDMGCDSIDFSKVIDWGSWSKEEFAANCIWDENHPDYNHFISVLADPILSHWNVYLGNILPYRKLAIQRQMANQPLLQKYKIFFSYYLRTKFTNLFKKLRVLKKKIIHLFKL